MKFTQAFKKNRDGFTLIEVMVAVGIVAVSLTALLGLLAAIIGNVNLIRQQTKALSIVTALESQLKQMPFSYVYTHISDIHKPYVIYYWDEYQNPDDVSNSSMIMVSSEDPDKVPQSPPTREDLRNSSGEIYRVMIYPDQSGLVGQYISLKAPGDAYTLDSPLPQEDTDYAMFILPLSIKVYVDPRDNILEGMGNPELNEQRLVLDGMRITKTR